MDSELMKSKIKMLYSLRRPYMIWGSPGIGKTDVQKQAAEEIKTELDLPDFELRFQSAATMDPTDQRGLPFPDMETGITKWLPPDFLPTSGHGILFFDDLPTAPLLVQTSLYALILDRKIGNYTMPDGWMACGAGNMVTDRAGAIRPPTALASRFVHLYLDVSVDCWCRWALANDIYPPIVSFIRFRPQLLHDFDPTRPEFAFSCPRTLKFESDILKVSPDVNSEFELTKGIIGEAVATELMSFLRIYTRLPNPDSIIMNPKTADVPTDTATLFAICGALARRATDNNFGRIVEYADRLPAEFSTLLVMDAVARDKSLETTIAFTKWAASGALN